ncbi:multidrug transporter [Arsenicicoccus sp. oral taxon 190]|nr:multidrug transporter [Arsenicicoccus sp. oral taxon 190]
MTTPTPTPTAITPPQDPQRWKALAVLAAGLAMIVLDGTIVGVALPTIMGALHLDLTDAQWVNSIYSVVFAALLLTAGRVGDRVGRRTTFVVGVLAFLVGSLLAATATSVTPLIWSRVVQGVGGALILPSTLSTVSSTFRGRDRAAAFGVWGAVMSGSAALGPLLGGWLTETFSWPWIFWVNVPIGLAVVAGTLLWVPQTRGRPAARGVDVDGLLTSGIGFGLVVFALIEGSTLGWWAPAQRFTVAGWSWPAGAPVSVVPVALVVGLLFVGLFVLWERHRARVRRDALLDLSVFGYPTFSWGNLTAGAVAVGEFALVLVLPLYLVNVAGLSTMGTGLVLAAMALGAFASGAAARHVAARLGAPTVVVVGLLLELVGVLAVALVVGARSAVPLLVLPLVVYGVGLGLASAQLTSTVLADLPTDLSGQGSATQSTVRQLGAALGSALGGSALAAGLAAAVPARLGEVVGLPPATADRLVSRTVDSAGGLLAGLRAQGEHGPLGPLTGPVVEAVASGAAAATRTALLVAAGALLLGLAGALRVRREAGRRSSTDAAEVGGAARPRH